MDNGPVFLPGYTALLSLSVHFALFPQFTLQDLTQLQQLPPFPAQLLLLGDGKPLGSQKGESFLVGLFA